MSAAGPLREAMRQLIEEGLLVTVPYTGTHVAALSVEDVREIYSLRTALEIFAFEQVWERRDDRFRRELHRRNEALLASIDAGDDRASILTELELHGLVYEASGHRLLQRAWHGLRGRLQLYWAAHHRAHGRRGPRRDSHDSYISGGARRRSRRAAPEIADHMRRGAVAPRSSSSPGASKTRRHDMTIKRRTGPGWPAALGFAAGPCRRCAAHAGTHRGDQAARHPARRRHPGAALVLQGSRRPANGPPALGVSWARRWPTRSASSSSRSR